MTNIKGRNLTTNGFFFNQETLNLQSFSKNIKGSVTTKAAKSQSILINKIIKDSFNENDAILLTNIIFSAVCMSIQPTPLKIESSWHKREYNPKIKTLTIRLKRVME